MSRTYAIPDLHGRLDLLDRAIDAVVRHAEGLSSTIITLGDYVDRGPQSRQVIERLMNWRPEESKVVNLKGNHEAMMCAVCENRAELDWWVKNGEVRRWYRMAKARRSLICGPSRPTIWTGWSISR